MAPYGCYCLHMDRRTLAAQVADTVAAAMIEREETPARLAEAIGLPLSDLDARFDHRSEFTFSELGRVGGFLRIHPADLIGAAT
jgi:hypothetical protein